MRMSEKKSLLCLASTLILVMTGLSTALAQQNRPQFSIDAANFTQTDRVEYIKPDLFFSGELQYEEIPELKEINSQKNVMMKNLVNSLMRKGIAVGITKSNQLGPSNQSAFFNLYDPSSFSFSLSIPPINYGISDETLAGRLNFLTHDPVHLDVGIFSPRMKDVLGSDGKVDAKKVSALQERLTRYCLLNEALTTSYTFYYHLQYYWSYRNAVANSGNPEKIKEFDSLNRGLGSFMRFTPADQLDLMLAHIDGKFMEHVDIMDKKIDFDLYRKAREAKVPMMFPDTSKYVGIFGEKLIAKYGLAFIITAYAYLDGSGGYKALLNYSKMQAKFYSEPWYIEWAERFAVGQDLDSWEKDFWKKADDFKNGKYLTNEAAAAQGIYTVMAIKNSMAQLGRKLIELRFLMQQNPQYYSQSDINEISRMTSEISAEARKYDQMGKKNLPISNDVLIQAKNSLESYMERAEGRFPISKFIPSAFRLGHADYSSFWRDATAVVLPRPEDMVNFPSNKDVWKAAQLERIKTAKMKVMNDVVATDATADVNKTASMQDWVEELAKEYNKNRKGDILDISSNETDSYLKKIDAFRDSLVGQIDKVFSPQIIEYPNLTNSEKQDLIEMAQDFKKVMSDRINQLKGDYRALFIEGGATNEVKARLFAGEVDIKDAADLGLFELVTIIERLNGSDDYSDLKKNIASLKDVTERIQTKKPIQSTLQSFIRLFMPMKKGRLTSFCSAVAKACLKSDLTKVIHAFKPSTLLRVSAQTGKAIVNKTTQAGQVVVKASTQAGKAVINKTTQAGKAIVNTTTLALIKSASPDFSFVDRNKGELSQQARLGLEPDAIVVLVMNHDKSIAELQLLKEINHRLGFKRNMVLTTKRAWPHLNVFQNQDDGIILIEDKFREQVIDRLNKNPNVASSVTVFPEGLLATYGAQMPLISKYGAFKLARELAVDNKGKRPVYLVSLRNNILEVNTSASPVDLKIEILDPVKVPTEPISKNDPWMEAQRVAFQAFANEGRGTNQVDMISAKKIPGSSIYSAGPVREYRDINQSMSCRRAVAQ